MQAHELRELLQPRVTITNQLSPVTEPLIITKSILNGISLWRQYRVLIYNNFLHGNKNRGRIGIQHFNRTHYDSDNS